MIIPYLQSIAAGLCISLMGSIPLGNLNLAAMQMAMQQANRALRFAVGVVLVEMAYLAVTLWVLGRYAIDGTGLFYFKAASIILLVIMAVGSFSAGRKKRGVNVVLNNGIKPMALGILMSAVNPMQIPFWIGWVFYLMSHNMLVDNMIGKSLFVVSAGAGTFIAMFLFIFAGKKFSVVMYRHQKTVNVLFGGIFLLLAAAQFIQLL
jgi:threonine/homoserine/homoserine lactone efflux protein